MRTNKFSKLIVGLFLLVSLFQLSGCEKHVTHRKAERILFRDTWRIQSLVINTNQVADLFLGLSITFGEADRLNINGTGSDVHGKWVVGLNNKPTTLYIDGLQLEPYSFLNEDWEIITCSKSSLTLQSVNGSVVNKMSISRIED